MRFALGCLLKNSHLFLRLVSNFRKTDMNVIPIPALSDNYMYLIIDEKSKAAAAVDPVEPEKIKQVADSNHAKVNMALTTHHHWDHAGGNGKFAELYPGVPIYGGDQRVEAVTDTVAHGNKIKIGELEVECLSTPCHTSGHVCYFVRSKEDTAVFTGDTLFIAGCGKFFEGTAEQMYKALLKILAPLPAQTKVFCGHEYTVSNLLYARHVEPQNDDIAKKLDWAKKMVAENKFTVPSSIAEELKINPFMRVEQPSVLSHAKCNDPVKAMNFLRDEKNGFKAKV